MPNTREKLIELLENCVDKNVDPDDPYVGFDVAYGNIADYLIANGVTVQDNTEISDELLERLRKAPVTVMTEEPTVEVVQGWIPVTERLPKGAKQGETSENVIAYTIDGEVTTGWLDALGSDKWWLVIGTDDTHTCWGLGYVTHWMPLPEPPKGE